MWDLPQQFIPAEDDFGLYQLHPGPVNESIHQLGNLGSELHPIRPPGSPISCLPNALKSMGIGQQPLQLIPSFLPHVFIQELPYVEDSQRRQADGGLGHLPHPSPGSYDDESPTKATPPMKKTPGRNPNTSQILSLPDMDWKDLKEEQKIQ